MATREKAKRYTSPKGTFVYPRLFTPDTKFNEAGVYSVRLALNPADGTTTALISQIDEALTASVAAAKKENPKKTIKRADAPYKTDEETGNIVLNFKMTASGVSKKTGEKWERKPAVFDARGQILGPDSKVGGGSIGRVSFELMPFYTALVGAGVSLRLVAVQVVEIVEWGGGDAKSFGFEVEDAEPETAAETEDVAEGEF